jgi:hypothetical protein
MSTTMLPGENVIKFDSKAISRLDFASKGSSINPGLLLLLTDKTSKETFKPDTSTS